MSKATSTSKTKKQIIPETPEMDTPVSEEVKLDSPEVVTEVIPEPVEVEVKVTAVPPKDPKPIEAIPVRPEMDSTLPHETRILAFLKSRGTTQFVKLNDFLKALYPIPRINESPQWAMAAEAKTMQGLLGRMQAAGKILLSNDNYKRLGKFYYPPNESRTHHHNIGTTTIEAKLG